MTVSTYVGDDNDSSGVFCAVLDDSPQPLDRIQLTEEIQTLREQFSSLGDSERELLGMWLNEYSNEKMRSATGLTEGTVKTRLFHAKKRLHQLMNE